MQVSMLGTLQFLISLLTINLISLHGHVYSNSKAVETINTNVLGKKSSNKEMQSTVQCLAKNQSKSCHTVVFIFMLFLP